jgi:hypothetical protein
MFKVKSIWHFSNLLSLDVVFGAMAGMLFFADVLNVVVPVESYLILGMAVWSIYTLDHLWDARFVSEKASSDRHRFHQQNFRTLSGILIFTIISGLVIVLLTPQLKFILVPGLFLGFMMLIWMGILHLIGKKLSWLKEVSTAVFYVLGISLAPFFKLLPNEIPFPFYIFLIGYFILAFVNLLILSFLDEKEDKRDGFGSILQHVRKPQLRKYINFLGLISAMMMVAFVIILPSYFKIHASILLLLILFHILEFQKNDRGKTRQKLEASFLLPFILLFF